MHAETSNIYKKVKLNWDYSSKATQFGRQHTCIVFKHFVFSENTRLIELKFDK